MNVSYTIEVCPKELYARALETAKSSPEKGLELAFEAIKLAEEKGDYKLAISINTELSNQLRKQGNVFGCIERLNHAYRLLNTHAIEDKSLLAEIYREFGSIYIDGIKDYAIGIEYFYKCLSLDIPETNTRLYPSIAYAFICTKQFDLAAKYLAIGEKINTETNNYNVLSFIYENKAEMFVQMGKVNEAIGIYQLGINTAKKGIALEGEFSYSFILGHMLTALAKCHLTLGQMEKVIPLLDQVFPISDRFNLNQIRTAAALVKSEYYIEKKQYSKFTEIFDQETKLCSDFSLHTELNRWYDKMINVCELLGDFRNGLKYSKLLIKNRKEYDQKTKAINITKVLESKEKEILTLQEKNREMQLQKQEIEQFAYIVAHDLKTPLSNISNFGGLFLNNFKEKIDAKNQEHLNLVVDSAKQMHKMLDELLRYTSVEKISGKLYPVDIEGIINTIKTNFERENKTSAWPNIIFKDLPKVKIHPKHIYLILDHMIRNSIKFCKKEEPSQIKIEIIETKKAFNFLISDNGIGIAPAFRSKVFELFKRLDKVDYTGTGMGLALSKKIVNTYGGKISVVDSSLGGVSFEFDIPKRK